jgi:hypothetical protein
MVLVCFRNPKDDVWYRLWLDVLAERLVPGNISPSPTRIIKNEGILIGLISPNETVLINKSSVCLGHLVNPGDDWWKPKAEAPDGSYALFRSDESYIELLTDVVASRTIWYAHTDHCFIASSSQRAVVSLLRDFQPNYEASLWMLSSGSLGPGLSWDRRIRCLSGDSRLSLNRMTWQTTYDKAPVTFDAIDVATEEHKSRLHAALMGTIGSLRLDYSKWVLPLSGGFDSRALLLLLAHGNDIQTITWGLKSSMSQPYSDAFIARSLASCLNVRHRFFELDATDDSVETIFERFLSAGEGRIDHLSAYADGFSLWKTLFEDKIMGIIRGDEGFGWVPVQNDREVTSSIGATRLADLWQIDAVAGLGMRTLGKQTWPADYQRREAESLSTWRDRLYHQWRIPFILAALNELKTSYVEVVNPFLSRNIIAVVRTMPDRLRTNKNLFRQIVERLNPEIEFAKYHAIPNRGEILAGRKGMRVILEELSSSYAVSLLPKDFLSRISDKLNIISGNSETSRSPLVHQTIRTFIILLAFRVYVICKMNRLMTADSNALKH